MKDKAGLLHKANATKAALAAKVDEVEDKLEAVVSALKAKHYHVAFSGSGTLFIFQLAVSAALADYGVYSDVRTGGGAGGRKGAWCVGAAKGGGEVRVGGGAGCRGLRARVAQPGALSFPGVPTPVYKPPPLPPPTPAHLVH